MPEVQRKAAPAAWPTQSKALIERWRGGRTAAESDVLAEEAPIALTYGGVPHVVMLATPADLEDLAIGFTLSESIVDRIEEVRSVEVREAGEFPEVRLEIAPDKFSRLLGRQRNLLGRTGCGLCGVDTVENAIREPAKIEGGCQVQVGEVHAALAELAHHQPLNALVGSVHGAAWVLPGQGIQVVREDVGRHNALDKLLGHLARSGANFSAGYVIVTSRASYEMVQKSATLGVSLLVAVSAPTRLAVRLADSCGMTLVGFARATEHVVYSHAGRLAIHP
jgi:FdhD protein